MEAQFIHYLAYVTDEKGIAVFNETCDILCEIVVDGNYDFKLLLGYCTIECVMFYYVWKVFPAACFITIFFFLIIDVIGNHYLSKELVAANKIMSIETYEYLLTKAKNAPLYSEIDQQDPGFAVIHDITKDINGKNFL